MVGRPPHRTYFFFSNRPHAAGWLGLLLGSRLYFRVTADVLADDARYEARRASPPLQYGPSLREKVQGRDASPPLT